MKIIKVCTFLVLVLWNISHAQNISSPNEFLPNEYGVDFTPHHALVAYFKHAAENTAHIEYREYGKTNENRPLIYTIISDPSNLKSLDKIKEDNQIRALEKSGSTSTNIPIVWLSYGVHGNEAGASESAIATIFELATLKREGLKEWLKKVVVILDPCINPDGYSRYTSWNSQVANKLLNPNPSTREHNEPWPGGRVNHYLFDLNRDWAWLTQIESQQRIKIYQDWIPQVHVDFHEMGHNSPYYFAPAAKPYHEFITEWQGDFQKFIGTNHAKYFDEKGWHYFSKEVFDLLYPSYGDTYPIFNGAIGMTYEQGGHSRAGKGILMDNGDTLLLADRIEHHLTTGISTIETAASNSIELVNNFETFYKNNSTNPPGEYKSYVVNATNGSGKLNQLTNLLDQHNIRYSFLEKGGEKISGWNYRTFKNGEYSTQEGDLVISAKQPKSVLTQVLFEPKPKLEDSLTYDITAWALPYAYGLDAIASNKEFRLAKKEEVSVKKATNNLNANSYVGIITWEDFDAARLTGKLLEKGINIRKAAKAFRLEGNSFPAGTLLINRRDNEHLNSRWYQVVNKMANEANVQLTIANTGLSQSGPDLGSSNFELLKSPKILILGGEKVGVNDFGQVWYYLEQELNFPSSVVDPDDLGNIELSEFTIIIMPSGSYNFSDSQLSDLKSWVSSGGRIIAIGGALRNFADKDGFGLKRKSLDKSENEKKKGGQKIFGEEERAFLSAFIPGAIFKVKLDHTHPLLSGFGKDYAALKTGNNAYELLEKGWNLGIIEDRATHLGFAGVKAVEKAKNSLALGVESKGRGEIIYFVDNPLFRSFWKEGGRLLANMICLQS